MVCASSRDLLYSDLIRLLEANPSLPLPKRSHIPTNDLFLEDGLLFRSSAPGRQRGILQRQMYNQLVIPEVLVPMVLLLLYEVSMSSHSGVDKAIKTARSQYFFPRLVPRVIEHVRKCQRCMLWKAFVSVPAPVLTSEIPEGPFQYVSVDVLSGFFVSATGNRYLLVFIDNFSWFCELVPIPDKSSATVACTSLDITPQMRSFHIIAPRLRILLQSLCSTLEIKRINILPYSPQANRITERLNRIILNMLRTSLASSTSGTYHPGGNQ